MLGASPMRRLGTKTVRSLPDLGRLPIPSPRLKTDLQAAGGSALCGAAEKQIAFTGVTREGGGALEFGAGFVYAAEFGEQVAAHAWQ